MQKTLVAAALCGLMSISTAQAQTAPVSPEEARALRFGTKYVPRGATNDDVQFVRVANGFYFINKARNVRVTCNDVSRAGGRGNATINCADQRGWQFRFEWINPNEVKAQWWESMAAKAGTVQNKAAGEQAVLYRR